MEENQYELVVCAGNRPIWKTIVSALCFTLFVFVLMLDISVILGVPFAIRQGFNIVSDIKGLSYLFACGVFVGLQKDILIDVDTNKLISRYHLGMFSKRHIAEAPQLEYIAVFKNANDKFEVNLWYKGNKHHKMYRFDDKADAMSFGEIAAKKLKLDLLDKTVKGGSNWIEYRPD